VEVQRRSGCVVTFTNFYKQLTHQLSDVITSTSSTAPSKQEKQLSLLPLSLSLLPLALSESGSGSESEGEGEEDNNGSAGATGAGAVCLDASTAGVLLTMAQSAHPASAQEALRVLVSCTATPSHSDSTSNSNSTTTTATQAKHNQQLLLDYNNNKVDITAVLHKTMSSKCVFVQSLGASLVANLCCGAACSQQNRQTLLLALNSSLQHLSLSPVYPSCVRTRVCQLLGTSSSSSLSSSTLSTLDKFDSCYGFLDFAGSKLNKDHNHTTQQQSADRRLKDALLSLSPSFSVSNFQLSSFQ